MSPAFAAGTTEEERSPPMERQVYECTLLLNPGTPPSEAQDILKNIAQEAAGLGGEIKETDLWGRRGLAYSIGGNTEAFFVVLLLALPPHAAQEFSRLIRIMKPVLRHLLVRPEPGYTFLKYSERFEQWQKEREQQEKERQQEKEEKLKQQILKKAIAPKAPLPRREEARKGEAISETEKISIDEQLKEIISDENLNL